MPIPAEYQTPYPWPAVVFQSLTGDKAPPPCVTTVFAEVLSDTYPNNLLPLGERHSWIARVGNSPYARVELSRIIGRKEDITLPFENTAAAARFIRAVVRHGPAPAA